MTGFVPLLAPLGAGLFTLTWFVLGLVSPGYPLFDQWIAPYSPISQPISGLGLGVTGPYMNTAFVVCGLLVLVGVLASLHRLPRTRSTTVGLILIALAGVGMIIDGVFTLESVMPHLMGFLLGVPVPALGFFIVGMSLRRRMRHLAMALLVSSVLTITLFAVFMVTFDPYSAGDNVGTSGALQRVLTMVVLVAVSMVGLSASRSQRTGDEVASGAC